MEERGCCGFEELGSWEEEMDDNLSIAFRAISLEGLIARTRLKHSLFCSKIGTH